MGDKFIFTTSDICEFFSISRKTLVSWEKKGAPKKERGKWDLRELIEWKYGSEDPKNLEARKLQADVNYRETKAELIEIQKQEKIGQFISVDDIEKNLSEVFSRIKQGLLYMGHKIATEINAQYPEISIEVKKLVDEEVNKGLLQIAETGTYEQKRTR